MLKRATPLLMDRKLLFVWFQLKDLAQKPVSRLKVDFLRSAVYTDYVYDVYRYLWAHCDKREKIYDALIYNIEHNW